MASQTKTMNESIRMLGTKELALKWHIIEPMIDRAMVHGNGDIEPHDLFMFCMSANAQCWVLEDEQNVIIGAAITRYIQNLHNKELCIVTTTAPGFLIRYGKEVLAHFEEFARQSECDTVSILGRKGWERWLPEEYYVPYQTYYRRL